MGSAWEKHLIRRLTEYWVGRSIGDDTAEHMEHTIESHWDAPRANTSGAWFSGSCYRADDQMSIASSMVRDILGDDESNDDGSVDDRAEGLRDYKRLEETVLRRYYGNDGLRNSFGRDKSPPPPQHALKRRPI